MIKALAMVIIGSVVITSTPHDHATKKKNVTPIRYTKCWPTKGKL